MPYTDSTNYYGSLCTEMYELLHAQPDEEELDLYLSYARPEMKILEPLCGSGRMLIPFLRRGYDITGMDLSAEMLDRLRQKAPEARAIQANLIGYRTDERYDYIFIPSGSIVLFTDLTLCREILTALRGMLREDGVLVFSVDTVASRSPDDAEYREDIRVQTPEGLTLTLRTKHRYDPDTQTQFSPEIYELFDGGRLLRQEEMDFQTHLYRPGEMEELLQAAGFTRVVCYASHRKEAFTGGCPEMLLYECRP